MRELACVARLWALFPYQFGSSTTIRWLWVRLPVSCVSVRSRYFPGSSAFSRKIRAVVSSMFRSLMVVVVPSFP